MLPKIYKTCNFFLSCFVTRKNWRHWRMDDRCLSYIAKLGKKEKEKGFFLAQKFAPVLDKFVANSMTFKKEITKN